MIELIEDLARFSSDPYAFVLWAFPWGEAGELERFDGPEVWQVQILTDLRDGLISIEEAILLARTSGHGIGKSALVAWIIWWAVSTFEDTRGVVTANTENQLKTKTWVEVAKWHRLFIAKDLFKFTATAIFSSDPEHEKTWRIDMVPWSERNTEAFAGLHNQGKRILVVYDEASAIPDVIWEVTEGALTDRNTQIIWVCFGNPTRNKGRFRECFPGGKFAHRWKSAAIDSRTVSFTDKKQIARWAQDYGEDSDFFRVRVRGVFPRVDSESFIPYDLAKGAVGREVGLPNANVILGVDVGRFGDDPSVIYPRQGLDASSRPPEVLYGIDTMSLVKKVVEAFHRYNATWVFVDEGGVGGGVVDRLRQLRIPVIGVDFGAKAQGSASQLGVKYANRRAEIWGELRDWLPRGSIVERLAGSDLTLVDELVGPNYGLNNAEAILLESKKDMRRRGVPSPNAADALALTFGEPTFEIAFTQEDFKPTIVPDFHPYSTENIYGFS